MSAPPMRTYRVALSMTVVTRMEIEVDVAAMGRFNARMIAQRDFPDDHPIWDREHEGEEISRRVQAIDAWSLRPAVAADFLRFGLDADDG